MLDVGMVGYLDEKTMAIGVRLIQAVVDKNPEQTIRGLEYLGVIPDEFDRSWIRVLSFTAIRSWDLSVSENFEWIFHQDLLG